jgi:flavorubredoxin
MNHAEPDHAGAIPHIMKIAQKAKLVTTSRGSKMAQIYYHVPQERIKIVSDRETINLGNRTLHFIEAPMLHWPETMFTYLEEDKILFHVTFSAPILLAEFIVMKLRTYLFMLNGIGPK